MGVFVSPTYLSWRDGRSLAMGTCKCPGVMKFSIVVRSSLFHPTQDCSPYSG